MVLTRSENICVTIFAWLLVLRSLVCFVGGFARGISLFLAAQIPWPRCLRSFLHMQCQDPWPLRVLLKLWLYLACVFHFAHTVSRPPTICRGCTYWTLVFLQVAGPCKPRSELTSLDISVVLTRSGQLACHCFSRATASGSFWPRPGAPMHSYNLELGGSFSRWGAPGGAPPIFAVAARLPFGLHCFLARIRCVMKKHIWGDSERTLSIGHPSSTAQRGCGQSML